MQRVRQFLRAIFASVSAEDERFLQEFLSEQEQSLFCRMLLADQYHALQTAYTAQALWAKDAGAADERLLTRCALLHDIGKVLDSSPSHPQTGREILSRLKMGSYVADLALRHHQPQPCASIELEILVTVDCFVNLLSRLSDKQTCIEHLRQSSNQSSASAKVLAALEQVLRDEQFLEKLTGRFT